MSGLAEILLLSTPLEISGCDRERSENTDRLTKLGAKIAYGHDPKHVLETDLLVTSAAVPDSSPEVEAARQRGATLQLATEVLGATRAGSRLTGVVTTQGRMSAGWVVNAAGTWAQGLSESLGAPVPVLPRRGLILVTEPLPPIIRHKVYSADYVANVASSSASLQTSTVIEGTLSGPVLIGSSRERVGYDRSLSVPVLRQMAREATRLFPVLARVHAIRAYAGFRPYSPDHLPVIGLDPRVEGLVHACGHEGAGIGLAPATGEMVCELMTGKRTHVAAEPFSPTRFAAGG